MKTVEQDVLIRRNRYVQCPHCKTRGLKLKRVVRVGRCRTCHESYRIITRHVKPGEKKKVSRRVSSPVSKPGLPAWPVPSDTSLFGSPGSSFAGRAYGWGQPGKGPDRETGSDQ